MPVMSARCPACGHVQILCIADPGIIMSCEATKYLCEKCDHIYQVKDGHYQATENGFIWDPLEEIRSTLLTKSCTDEELRLIHETLDQANKSLNPVEEYQKIEKKTPQIKRFGILEKLKKHSILTVTTLGFLAAILPNSCAELNQSMDIWLKHYQWKKETELKENARREELNFRKEVHHDEMEFKQKKLLVNKKQKDIDKTSAVAKKEKPLPPQK